MAGLRVRGILLGTILVLMMVTQPSALASAGRAPTANSSAWAADEGLTAAPVGAAYVEAPSPARDLRTSDRQPVPSTHDYWSDFACPPPAEAPAYVYDTPANFTNPAFDEGRVRRVSLGFEVQRLAPRSTTGLADDVLGIGDEALEGLTASQRRSVRSLQTNITEHEAKLAAYIDDRYAYDNLRILANAPSVAVRELIIEGRIRHLENEITEFADQIRKITGAG